VDPIHPITPGPAPVARGRLPVQPLERITRERDRPSREQQQQRRRRPPPPSDPHPHDDDDDRPRIDVRA
jgi:hypothetical protein